MPQLTRVVWIGLLLTVGMGGPCFSAQGFTAKVVGVADGDTIAVLLDRTQVRVRLDGIDCPESGQAFGSRAKAFTSELVFAKVVTIRPRNKDRYGRTVAEVLSPDGRDVTHELVRSGFAWWIRKYAPRDTELARLEAEAQAARRGLWVDPHPIPPWEWRNQRRLPLVTKMAWLSATVTAASNSSGARISRQPVMVGPSKLGQPA